MRAFYDFTRMAKLQENNFAEKKILNAKTSFDIQIKFQIENATQFPGKFKLGIKLFLKMQLWVEIIIIKINWNLIQKSFGLISKCIISWVWF